MLDIVVHVQGEKANGSQHVVILSAGFKGITTGPVFISSRALKQKEEFLSFGEFPSHEGIMETRRQLELGKHLVNPSGSVFQLKDALRQLLSGGFGMHFESPQSFPTVAEHEGKPELSRMGGSWAACLLKPIVVNLVVSGSE